MSPRTVDSVKSMKVQELKEELKGLGLPASGVKADLVKRLEEALTSSRTDEDMEPAAVEEKAKEEGGATTTVTVEVEGDVAPEVVEAAAEAAAEAAEEVVKEEGEDMEEEGEEEDEAEETADIPGLATADEIAAVEEAATDAPVTEEVKAEDDAADETEEAEAMDTAEDVSTAPVKEEEDDTEMAEPPTAAESNGTPGHRLFVGCVPPKFSEDDLKARFQEMGAIKDVSILRDQSTGVSRGCAFVIYEELAHAEAAIAKLDKKIKLPGATSQIEVRFAKETNKVQPTIAPNDQNMLFFARAPLKATEDDIKTAFGKHGEVKEISLFKAAGGGSKGCGFVFFEEQEGAIAAISAMNEKTTMEGGFSPLTVKWADPNLTEKKRKAAEISEPRKVNSDNTQIFYARIPRTVDEAALTEVFSKAGKVSELILFKINKEANTSKGCGIVTYASHDEAANALATLNETHTFPPLEKTMVLKWVDHDLQDSKKRKIGPGNYQGGPAFGGGAMNEEDRPPQGCDNDAFKLYMVGVPRTWDVPELKESLKPYGTVVECNIVRNKETKEPRGVAFAWMKTRAQGERAIKEISKQGEGQQDPMKVSKAKPRNRMSAPGFGAPMSMGHHGGGPGPSFGGRPSVGFQPRMQAGYSVRPAGSYGPRSQASYGPRSQGGFSPRPQGGYAARPQFQQSSPYYAQSSGPSSYNYARPQQQQQPAFNNYQQPSNFQQQPSYQQPAPAYQQQAPAGYQAPAGQSQGYQPPVSNAGYQQPYNPPAQLGYRPPAESQAASGYGNAQVYEPQQPSYGAPQQAAYGAPQQQQQQYGAPDIAPQAQGGYNYQQPDPAPISTRQPDYAAPAAAAGYSYAPAQGGYAAPAEGGYNYSASQR